MSVNQAHHSRFFWRSSAMFAILDVKRRFMEVNTAWERVLGLSTGPLLTKGYLEFVHSDDRPLTEYNFEQLASGIASVSFSNRFRHFNGKYQQILWQINNAASTEHGYYLVGLDISNREQPMVADEMISVLQEGVVLQYANGIIGACNPSAERILGLEADQMMGWTLIDPDWKAIHEDNSPFPTETHPAICTLRTGQAYTDVVMGIVKPDNTTIWIRLNAHPLWRNDVTTPYAVVISFSDITHYKESEQALRRSVSQHEEGGTTAPVTDYEFWDWNLESNTINFSSKWKAMLGYEPEELPDHVETWHKRIHPNDYSRVMSDIQNHLDGLSETFENKHRLQHKDGTYRLVMCRAVMMRDTGGKPTHIVGTHLDLSESSQTEEETLSIKEKYQQILETENDAILLIDSETLQILEANRSATKMYGYNSNEFSTLKKPDLSSQPDRTKRSLAKCLKRTEQRYHKHRDGSVFPVEISLNPFILKGKKLCMITIRDVSERQKIETALWESESKYRQLFEAASNPTVIFDANSRQIFDVNQAAITLYGYTKEEWLRITTDAVSAEPSKPPFNDTYKKVRTIPLRWHKKKDGTVFPVEISTGSTYLFKGRSLICATLHDMTQRRAAEEAIRKEQEFTDTLVQASPAFYFAINPDGTIRMMNRAMLKAVRYTLAEVVNKDYLELFVPETEQAVVAAEFENLTKSMQPSLMENQVKTNSGELLLVEWHSRAIIKPNGELDYLFGVGIDVTERKKAQGHLRLFKTIIESSTEAITISNAAGELIYVNPAYERLFARDFDTAKEKGLRSVYPSESIEILESQMTPTLRGGSSWEGELDVLDNDNEAFPIWERVDAVRDVSGNILFVFNLMHDVSERKRMWETLRKQWEEHQMIFNAVPAMIWYKDKNNQLLRANKMAMETFGRDDESVIQYTDCQKVIESGEAEFNIEYHYRDLHREKRWMQMNKIPNKDSQDNITGAIAFAVDVTEFKQTQTSLQASEERMHLVAENLPFLLIALDEEGRIVLWNHTCEALIGYTSNEILNNHKALEVLYPDTTDRHAMVSRWYTVNSWQTRIMCKNGSYKNIAWHSVSKDFPIPGWYAWHVGRDITEIGQGVAQPSSSANQELIASVFEVSRLGLCLIDDRGRFVQVNQAYCDLYGYNARELIGQPFTLVLSANKHKDAVREYYSLLMAQDEPILLTRKGEQHRNGSTLDIQMLVNRIVLKGRRRLLICIVSKI